jgi:VWFA-related protein
MNCSWGSRLARIFVVLLAAFCIFAVTGNSKTCYAQSEQNQAPPLPPPPPPPLATQDSKPAQTDSSTASQEVSTHTSAATFSSRTNLVPVRVIVHDSQGRAVTNLSREDFQIFEDKKVQLITHFSVETPTSASQQAVRANVGDLTSEDTQKTGKLELASRFVAFLFDDVHLEMEDLMRARLAAVHYLEASFEPGERVAVLTTSGKKQLDFSDDRKKIDQALNSLLPEPIGPPNATTCPSMDYYEADLILNKNDQQAILMATEEAKICVPDSKDVPASVFSALVTSAARQILESGDSNTQYTLRRLQEVIRRISVLPGQRSIVLVSPGFMLTTQQMELSEIIDKATHQNVFINALDARGLYVGGADVDASQSGSFSTNPSFSAAKLSYKMQGESAQSEALADLAYGTGGFLFKNNNDLEAGFKATASTPETSYLLAFVPQDLKYDGKFHALKVTLLAKGRYMIQARRGFFAPKHSETPEEAAKQDIEEAVFSQEEEQGVPIDLHLQYFKSNSTDAKLSVLAHVDVANMRFDKADGRNRNELTVVAALFDRNGNFITASEKTVDMRLKDATLERLAHTGVTVNTSFDLKSGGYIVRLVVRDSKAALLSAKNGVVEIP